jgi:hypothetical protein
MKIYEGYNNDGELAYFEVPNTFLSRKTAIKIIKEIPNVEVLKEEKRGDVFCVFKLNEKEFEIWEPYGDNSRYHIGEKGEVNCSKELQIIRQKFSAHKPGFMALLGR